jgi:cytosine/adenosine deaminase-related metal-dependent hydrolase
MWAEWKEAYLAHKLIHRDPRRMNGALVAQMAIENNRNLVSAVNSGTKTGVLAPGAQADIIFVDYHPFTPLSAGNLPWHILFGFYESMVTTTIVAGKLLMRNRELLTLDEERISYEAQKLAPQIWQRYEQQFA